MTDVSGFAEQALLFEDLDDLALDDLLQPSLVHLVLLALGGLLELIPEGDLDRAQDMFAEEVDLDIDLGPDALARERELVHGRRQDADGELGRRIRGRAGGGRDGRDGGGPALERHGGGSRGRSRLIRQVDGGDLERCTVEDDVSAGREAAKEGVFVIGRDR